MKVRAKMTTGWIGARGDRGAELSLNVVTEHDKIKGTTENAIFGSSTPSGSVSLAGDFPVERFQDAAGEEFYVDIYPFNIEVIPEGALVAFKARRVFQSAPTTQGERMVSFRYAVVEPLGGDFRLSIANPSASQFLIDNEFVVVAIRVAMGRRSDQEIELLRAAIAEQEASCIRYNSAKLNAMPAEERAAKIEEWTRGVRRKLWRALGHTTAYTPDASLDDPKA